VGKERRGTHDEEGKALNGVKLSGNRTLSPRKKKSYREPAGSEPKRGGGQIFTKRLPGLQSRKGLSGKRWRQRKESGSNVRRLRAIWTKTP